MDVYIAAHWLLVFVACFSRFSVASADGPKAPKEYYALVSSTAEIPCVAGSRDSKLYWKTDTLSQNLKTRSRYYTDKNDPDLSVYVIKDVNTGDVGTFTCIDGSGRSSSVELIVVVPAKVQDLQAQATAPDEVNVTWRAPPEQSLEIKGYNIYATEVAAAGKEVKYMVQGGDKEEFVLTDISPGGTYDVQVAPLYHKGPDDIEDEYEGPRSEKVRVNTPKHVPLSELSPEKVKAEPWSNNTVLVTWQSPKSKSAGGVSGFIVFYQASEKKGPPPGQVEVRKPESGNRWAAVLQGLKTKLRYKIQVAPFTDGPPRSVGQKSPEIIFLHEGFLPELSIRAVPLSPDTVLVSVDTVGGDKLDKLRLLYSDDSAIKWNRMNNFHGKENYGIVNELQPRTRYFFMAKATVDKKARTAVTHVMTPPLSLAAPMNVTVSAQTENSVRVMWNYDRRVPVTGFIVRVAEQTPGDDTSQEKTKVVYKENEALIKDLESDQKYEVKVDAFDAENVGTCSEPIFFQLSVHGDTTTHATEPDQPPYFLDEQPTTLEVEAGKAVKLTCAADGFPLPTVRWLQDGASVGRAAERFSELTLYEVQKSTVVTCRASNPRGSIERKTTISVSRQAEAPNFVEALPESRVVSRGSELRQVCEASGYPTPRIVWYRNNVPVSSVESVQGRSEFVERRVDRDFELKCVASNSIGDTHTSMKVYVQDFLKAPVVRGEPSRRIERYQGDEVNIPCAFTGNPTPLVSWYDGETRMGEPELEQSTLKIAAVERASFYTCRGENLAGTAEMVVELRIKPKDTQQPGPSPHQPDYSVTLHHVPVSPSEAKIKWVVDRGNLQNIRYFDVALSSPTLRYPSRQRLGQDKRVIVFYRLTPQTRYTVDLQTVTNNGERVDNSSISFVQAGPSSYPGNREPVLHLNVLEVRDDNARLDFWTENIDRRQHYTYRIRVKDLDAGSLGNTIFDRQGYNRDTPNIIVESLKPNRNYEVILDAVTDNNRILLSSFAKFATPSPGQYGTPVYSSSDTPAHEVTELSTSTTTVATTTTATTRKVRTQPTPRTRPPPRTRATAITSPATTVTTDTTEQPTDHSYVMATKIPNKTPYRVDIKWTVDRGPIENITDFLITIKGDRGQILLEQNLPENQRYITIQSLNPDTTYFVNVKANGREGQLVESDVEVHTPPADTAIDQTRPVLELEANEIRHDNARIDWTVVNSEPDLVKSYRLKVLDGGPDDINLLTQKLHASSQSLNLQKLEPDKRYHVILEALAADNSVLLTSSLTFQTAKPNKYGEPVRAVSSPDVASRSTDAEMHREQPVPYLEMQITPKADDSTVITWYLDDQTWETVASFGLKVRNQGPDGVKLLERSLPDNTNTFTLSGLHKNRRYYIELQAFSSAGSGSPPLRADTVYTPGVSVTPIKVRAEGQPRPQGQDSRSRHAAQVDDDDDDEAKPEIDLELTPSGQDQVRVNWTVLRENRRRPINSYKLKVSLDGPEGHVLHETMLPRNTLHYIVFGMEPDTNYHIHLDALDTSGGLIEYVSAPYLVPPAGYPVEPYRTSSVFNKNSRSRSKPQPKDTGADSELVITNAEAQSPGTMLVEWHDVTSPTGAPSRNTVLRYAEFKNYERGSFKYEHVKAGQNTFTLRNLSSGTTYGIQVATAVPEGQFVRWSKIVLRKSQ